MKTILTIAELLDFATDLTLKVLGVRFIIIGQFVNGAICFGASGLWCLAVFAGQILRNQNDLQN